MRWSTSAGVDDRDFWKQAEDVTVNVGKWYEPEQLSSLMRRVHVMRPNPPVHLSSRELPWFHHLFHVNQFYFKHVSRIDVKSVDCNAYIREKAKECMFC